MTKTRKRDRAIALGMAIFFFVLACGFSLLVIYQMATSKNDQSAADATSQTNTKKTLAGTALANFTPVSSVPKLQITDTKVGTGATVKAGDTITADYTGAIASNGIIFQSTQDTGQPVSFDLHNVIKGWQDGIPGMKVGGSRRILIPAADAYGANPPDGSGIPANAALVFDVTVTKIGS